MNNIEDIINYTFKNKELLMLAQTHSSFGHKFNTQNNERLEFLGDSILGFIVADFLINNFNEDEGLLTKYRSSVVSCEHLSKIITTLKLEKFIKTSPENLNEKETVKGDFYEALLGAIYLDGGLTSAKNFVYKSLNLSVNEVLKVYKLNKDYKTILQELIQAKKGEIEYKLVKILGEENAKIFEMALYINKKFICSQKDSSKQKAENRCAEFAIKNNIIKN